MSLSDVIRREVATVRYACGDLRTLADAFDKTGNAHAASIIQGVADAVSVSMTNIQTEYANSLSAEHNENLQQIGSILKALVENV